MRRIMMVTLVAIIFGLGVLVGSVMTPVANAEEKKPEMTVQPKMVDDPLYYPNTLAPQYLAFGRWQIVRVAAPTPTGYFTVLLDTQGGDAFVLQTDRFSEVGVSWVHVPRRSIRP